MIPSALGVMGFHCFFSFCFLVYVSIMQSINVEHKISYCFHKKSVVLQREILITSL